MSPSLVESPSEYGELLAQDLPSVIHTEKQYESCLRRVEALPARTSSLTSAEKRLTELLALLIEDFEGRHYELPKASPVEVLAFLIDQHGLKQKDSSPVFGTPSIVSEVLSGKREFTKDHIKKLSDRFQVSPEIFF